MLSVKVAVWRNNCRYYCCSLEREGVSFMKPRNKAHLGFQISLVPRRFLLSEGASGVF